LKADGDLPVELWQNISAIYRTGIKTLNNRLSSARITFSQWSILRALGKFGSMPMTKLSEHMLVAPPNITGLVDRLEKKGYVERRRDSLDRRLFMIQLTRKGQETQQAISQQFRAYVRHVFSPLSDSDRAVLLSLLSQLKSSIERIEKLE
jgi:MarR family 2-MHQ and catechol resistance regulon transcriptional repressor